MVRRAVAEGAKGVDQDVSAFALIVFARLDSRRLPGKALADLCGRPMLGRVLDRLRRVAGRPRIVVATSDRSSDDPIVGFTRNENVAVFRGSAEDVAGRALACAEMFGLEAFVRISGDSPFIDPILTSEMIATHNQKETDLTTNIFPRTYPAGTSVEIITTAAMRRAVSEMRGSDEHEHVTPYFYRHGDQFRIHNVAAADDRYPDVRLAVDTPWDFEMATHVMARLGPRPDLADLDRVAATAQTCGWLVSANVAPGSVDGRVTDGLQACSHTVENQTA